MNAGVQKFIDDMAKAGFPSMVEGEVVTFQIVPVDGAHAGCSVDTGVSTGRTGPVAPGASSLGSFSLRGHVVQNKQPGVAETGMAHAQPQPVRLGRRPTCNKLGQPRSGSPQRGNIMIADSTSVAMTAATEKALLSLLVRRGRAGGPVPGNLPAVHGRNADHRSDQDGDPP